MQYFNHIKTNSTQTETDESRALKDLIVQVKSMIENQEYKECFRVITKSMSEFPDSAVPHNLLGLLLEHEGKHRLALRHFEAASALEPAYKPASRNLDTFSNVFSTHDQEDYGDETTGTSSASHSYSVKTDEDGIQYVVRSK